MVRKEKTIFSQRLSSLREERYLTLSDISELFDPPVSKSTVSNWENGHMYPKGQRLIVLCDFYNVSIDYLYGRTDSRKMNQEERIQACTNTN
ncbi:helix-turn-helix domain-containing protein [Enterococcus casseliflavus]|uniref:helix-turn-helix domain-containing protein n=1 Tax=Enterococcus casseliflavus TaxID=37734 RepID=UPI0013E3863B|nr:helix-turn-helix transcriptional regulator [Enterococcus casseliflavus]